MGTNQGYGMKGSSGNKQPFKAVTYQDIYSLKMILEQLQSWNEALELTKDFFDNFTHKHESFKFFMRIFY